MKGTDIFTNYYIDYSNFKKQKAKKKYALDNL